MASSHPQHQDVRVPENGIYIGDLDRGLSEEILFITLRELGTLKYLKVHRHPFIGVSKQFGFAYYANEEQAKYAKDELNHKRLLKMPLRVTHLKPWDKDANLLFTGFKPEVTLKEVDEFFSQWGTVFSAKFSYDDQGNSRGYGWVQFESKTASDACLADYKALNGEALIHAKSDSQVKVHQFVNKGQEGRADKRSNIFMKNFAPSVTFDVNDAEAVNAYEKEKEAEVRKVFEQQGAVTSVFVKLDKEKKAPYAFIAFANHEDAKKVVQRFDHKNVSENRDLFNNQMSVYISWAQRREDRKKNYEGNISDRYIFLSGVQTNVKEENLREALGQFGPITAVRFDRLQIAVLMSTRIAYVVFENAADAQRLIRTIEKFRSAPEVAEEADQLKCAEVQKLFEGGQIVLTNLFKTNRRKPGGSQRFNNQNQPRRSPNPRNFMQGGPFQRPPPMPYGVMPPYGGIPMGGVPPMYPPPMMMGGVRPFVGGPAGFPHMMQQFPVPPFAQNFQPPRANRGPQQPFSAQDQ